MFFISSPIISTLIWESLASRNASFAALSRQFKNQYMTVGKNDIILLALPLKVVTLLLSVTAGWLSDTGAGFPGFPSLTCDPKIHEKS